MVRVLAVADSDSYLKWSAATIDRLPDSWSTRQVIVASPISPSPEQARAAVNGPVDRLSLAALHRLLRRDPPDVLLLACTGPTVEVLAGLPTARGRRRPVLVTGLPGISLPASQRAVEFRRGCDLFVVHSRREREDFVRLAVELAPGLGVALSRLPFLNGDRRRGDAGLRTSVVFAAQARVPPRRADRESILLALAAVRPTGSAVVKVRAISGEQQTHREEHPYAELWAALVSAGRALDGAVRFAAGPMDSALADARCLVTVSSTAALEAIAVGVPVVVLTDFGVDAAMINLVFEGSGCLGDLADVRAGRAFRPHRAWLVENYFHPSGDDLVARIEALLVARRAGALPPPPGGSALSRRRIRALARLIAHAPLVRTERRLSAFAERQAPGRRPRVPHRDRRAG